MRLVMLNGLFAGIGATILVFALLTDAKGLVYFSLVFLIIVAVIAIRDTLTEIYTEAPGFVHPEDKLVGNYSLFCLIIAEMLTFGYFYKDIRQECYIASLVIFAAFLFLYLFTLLEGTNPFPREQRIKTITQKNFVQKEKEATARLILFAIILGSIIAIIQLLFLAAYDELEYSIAATSLGITAAATTGFLSLILLKEQDFPA